MQNPTDLLILIGALLTLVFSGIHIAVALGLCSMLGLFMMTGDVNGMISFASSTAYEALRDYIFAVIPLFMLMGEFLAKCGAARDLFTLVNRSMHRIRGRLGTATVLANALFAFVTGVSIAAAAAFSKIAYPEMRRHGYERKFALGCIAGSACLGMLIPPSVLMIVWGVLTELSIGKLFIDVFQKHANEVGGAKLEPLSLRGEERRLRATGSRGGERPRGSRGPGARSAGGSAPLRDWPPDTPGSETYPNRSDKGAASGRPARSRSIRRCATTR